MIERTAFDVSGIETEFLRRLRRAHVYRWQATKCSFSTSTNGGSSEIHL